MTEQAEGDTASAEAAALSRRGASKGGKARAQSLSPAERSEIARQAAVARWGTSVPDAPHVGTFQIGDIALDCAVTSDGTRLINQRKMLAALGRTGGARRGEGARKAPFLSAGNLQEFVSPELRELAEHPVKYRIAGGFVAHGYRAEMLPLVCEVYIDALAADVLTKNQMPVARAAAVLHRGLARVGIVALVDEATGYQEVRARQELEDILDHYVQAELRSWVKMFPDEFFEQIYRLQGWEFRPGTSKRTPYVGKLVNKYVYDQLPTGIREELEHKNPRTGSGHRRHKHHQFLTADTGNPHLDTQISTVATLMRISRDRGEFEILFERAFPPPQPRLPYIIDAGLDEDEG